jgi:hypothetical protein
LFAIERRSSHDHACCAKAALERLRLEKCLLHWMQITIAGKALDGRHLTIRCPESWYQATVHGLPVEPHGTSAAVTAIATFLDAEPAKVADKCSQALARSRFCVEAFSVNLVAHKCSYAERSWLICSAK